ncbi:MAG: neutral/alkaline non-lysosomal ceramidase N-terminal domain-containing protein [Clostridia bacterium]|nr:neutral/alkaline non-lysosomal ceramidase N-terminal domain-containing protein [Clostridia bacterium]
MRCALYEADITGPIGSSIPGYFADRFTTGIKDKLYAKAFAATDGNTTFAMLELDCCELMDHYKDAILDRVCEMNDIARENVSVSVTHTHYGIPSGGLTGETPDEEFMKVCIKKSADCVTMALTKMEEADAYFAEGSVDGIAFNRIYINDEGIIRTQPPKEPGYRHYTENDPRLPVVLIKDKDGNPKGAVYSYACHQDCVGGLEYTGDYSSEVSIQLKKKYGNDFVSMYITGASGDINHVNPDRSAKADTTDIPHYRMMGRKIASELIRVIENEAKPLDTTVFAGCKKLEIQKRRATDKMIADAKAILADPNGRSKATCKSMLDYVEAQTDYIHRTQVQVFGIGNTKFFMLPGELFHRFAFKVKDALPECNCLFSTLSHGWNGYIPTPELVDMYQDLYNKIYEIKLCHGSQLERNAGNIIADAAIELAK